MLCSCFVLKDQDYQCGLSILKQLCFHVNHFHIFQNRYNGCDIHLGCFGFFYHGNPFSFLDLRQLVLLGYYSMMCGKHLHGTCDYETSMGSNFSIFLAICLKLAPMLGVALANFSRMLDFGFEVQTSSSFSFASFSSELSISSTFDLFPPTLCGD